MSLLVRSTMATRSFCSISACRISMALSPSASADAARIESTRPLRFHSSSLGRRSPMHTDMKGCRREEGFRRLERHFRRLDVILREERNGAGG